MLEIGILGPVMVRRDGRVVPVGGIRQRALLARLLVARGHSVPTSVLIHDLWNTRAGGDALKTAVSRLRGALGPDAVVHDGSGYALQVGLGRSEGVEVDAACFEAGIGRARAVRTNDPAGAAELYSRALNLWRGRALGDVEGTEWAQPEAARLEELRLVAIEERFGALITAGAAADIAADLAAAVRQYPWRERLTAHLMIALYRSGRQRDALEAFDRLSRSLREELGLEPSPTLRELERSILSQDAVLDPPPRVDDVPPPVGVAAATRFVGRAAELAQLEAAVGRSRVVSIIGPAGTGKTRLADQFLRAQQHEYRNGGCSVALGTVRTPVLVATHIATALGLVDSAETGSVEPWELLAGYLRDREMLLVLDGCEPALHRIAPLVEVLRSECPDLRVVTTSRDPLGLGEPVVALGPMATPSVGATDDKLTASDAVRLYLARGEQLDLTAPQDLAAIGELTRLLGGNPLAIELVAGLSGTVAPSVILDRAREMPGGPSGAPSLRTTFALSHEQLSPPERTLFRRAGVFAAGFGLAALEAVAGGDGIEPARVAPALEALEACALVYPMGYARDRRRMLDSVRDEALDRLRECGELEATLARQTSYYLQLTERCDRALRGHAQDEARVTLDLELDNLRDVLDRLLAVGDGETAARLTAALGDYWYLRGHWAEARRWVDRCVAATRGSGTLARARVLRSHANQAGFSRVSERMAELDEALAIVREHGATEDEVWVVLFMAGAAASTGDRARMLALVAEADQLIEALDDPWTRAVRRSYGAATDVQLDPSTARDEQLRAHRELLALGDRAWAGRCLWFAGSIARKHDLGDAEPELQRAIELCEAAGDRAATAHARASLARAAFARGEATASALFEQSVEELAAIGDSHCADKLRTAVGVLAGAR